MSRVSLKSPCDVASRNRMGVGVESGDTRSKKLFISFLSESTPREPVIGVTSPCDVMVENFLFTGVVYTAALLDLLDVSLRRSSPKALSSSLLMAYAASVAALRFDGA